MKTLSASVAGDAVQVHMVEGGTDVSHDFHDWIRRPRLAMGLDVETTGLNLFGGDTIRLVQFGDEHDAYVIDATNPANNFIIAAAIRKTPRLVLHNAAFDLLALDHHGYIPVEDVWHKVFDTRTMSHLLDPRASHEGGTGHGLKGLATHFLGDGADDYEKALKHTFRKLGFNKDTGWAGVPLDNEDYIRYSGMDPILTVRLFAALGPLVREQGLSDLYAFEREVAYACILMQRKGIRLDPSYAATLSHELGDEALEGEHEARLLGVDNINSPTKVGMVLEALGAHLPEQTSGGQPKVDRAVLTALAEGDGPDALVAAAVLKAKQAGKFRTAYVDASLGLMDKTQRVHPFINPLQARTARMSISDPPLQQLPSGDWRIRRLFVPSPGMSLISVDYAQVEMRILAALSGDKNMTEAILSGEDLHSSAARLMFGADFTDKQRKLAKIAGFAKVYGGGAAVIARQTGVDIPTAQNATKRYDRAFPGIKLYARKLQERAEFGKLAVVTPSGRRLPLDRDRTYAAVNYVVQSTARDVMAQALTHLVEAGHGDQLLLPIHDEVLLEAPTEDAADVAKAVADVMTTEFMGIPLTVDAEVASGSWGSLYGSET